uniref:Putative secreted protein n=1 Tax=Anopheles triannulatus TaxID=58253 RepID=A0A2M4B4X4_9DIPT
MGSNITGSTKGIMVVVVVAAAVAVHPHSTPTISTTNSIIRITLFHSPLRICQLRVVIVKWHRRSLGARTA